MAFKQGNRLAKGGKRSGAGRKPDEYYVWLRKVADDPRARKFVEDLVYGEPIEEKVLDTPDGEPTKMLVSASPETRRKMLVDIWDRARGKPAQSVELSGKDGGPITIEIVSYASKTPV